MRQLQPLLPLISCVQLLLSRGTQASGSHRGSRRTNMLPATRCVSSSRHGAIWRRCWLPQM